MRNIAPTLFALLMTLNSFIIYGQELMRRKKIRNNITEEFFVLKENKKVRHGQSISTHYDFFGRLYIIEYGQYDNNVKSGVWLMFYGYDPGNSLKAVGTYINNKKNSYWRYFYPGTNLNENVLAMIGSEKKTTVVKLGKENKEFGIEYDSTNRQIMCDGEYLDDQKVGVWNYYSKLGYQIHKFDHSTHQFVLNNLKEHENNFLVFLGDQERFRNYYLTFLQENRLNTPITKTSEAIYEIDETGGYKFISALGDKIFENMVEKFLKTVPNEWIYLNKQSTKRARIIAKVKYDKNSFNRYDYSLEIEIVGE